MEDKTKLYLLDVTPFLDPLNFKKGYLGVKLSAQRKIDGFKFDKDKNLSLGAELLLKYVLINEGLDYNSLTIKSGRHNKPYLDVDDFFFNVSHSGKYALIAISNKEVGCDIEEIEKADINVVKRFFHENEYYKLLTLLQKERNEVFYRLWTIKEAYRKNKGVGLQMALDEDDFSSCIDKADFEVNTVHMHIVNDFEGYMICVASVNPNIDDIKVLSIKDVL